MRKPSSSERDALAGRMSRVCAEVLIGRMALVGKWCPESEYAGLQGVVKEVRVTDLQSQDVDLVVGLELAGSNHIAYLAWSEIAAVGAP